MASLYRELFFQSQQGGLTMKTKRFLATLLTILTLVGSFPCMAFAADNSDENPEITSHTIVLSVPAADPDEEGIVPYIWDEQEPGIADRSEYKTKPFYVSDRYFAFEAHATATNGDPVNENYKVALVFNNSDKSVISGTADGSHYKQDWITVSSGTYYIAVRNYTSSNLKVYIKYYSWN